MNERKNIVTAKGNPVTLLGPELKAGDPAPGFTVLSPEMEEKSLSDFSGKIKVISVTPSLDTPVCDLQLKEFNSQASSLTDDCRVINISMDLPFALSRFCLVNDIKDVITYSDHRDASFGKAYGVLIKELRLLARSVFIIGRDDIIKYLEIVPKMSEQPDYERAFAQLKKIT